MLTDRLLVPCINASLACKISSSRKKSCNVSFVTGTGWLVAILVSDKTQHIVCFWFSSWWFNSILIHNLFSDFGVSLITEPLLEAAWFTDANRNASQAGHSIRSPWVPFTELSFRLSGQGPLGRPWHYGMSATTVHSVPLIRRNVEVIAVKRALTNHYTIISHAHYSRTTYLHNIPITDNYTLFVGYGNYLSLSIHVQQELDKWCSAGKYVYVSMGLITRKLRGYAVTCAGSYNNSNTVSRG